MKMKKKKKRKPKKRKEKKKIYTNKKRKSRKYKYCISTIATGLDCLSEQVNCVKVSFEMYTRADLQQVPQAQNSCCWCECEQKTRGVV